MHNYYVHVVLAVYLNFCFRVYNVDVVNVANAMCVFFMIFFYY